MRPISRRARRAVLAAAVFGSAAALGAGVASAEPDSTAPLGELDPSVMAQVNPATPEAAQAVADRTGLQLLRYFDQIAWAEFGVPEADAQRDMSVARAALRSDPSVVRVDWAQPGESYTPAYTPTDELFSINVDLRPLLNDPQNSPVPGAWHFNKANFPAAWDVNKGRADVSVAVIDSEFDTEHPDLKTKLLPGRNFDSGTPEYLTSNVRLVRIAEGPHGTHVAGIVGAVSDNGFGTTGACFDCTVIPYKIGFEQNPNIGSSKFVADLTEALLAAANDSSVVVNMSLQGRRDHQPLRDAVALVRSRGKVVVAAAGNLQLTSPGVPIFPAAYDGAFGVGSINPDDSPASSSSNGNFVDIAAPGNGILSLWDRRLVAGAGIPQQQVANIAPGFHVIGGTSMAAPMVSGLVALMKSARPDLTPDEVESIIQNTAFDLGARGKDQVFGAGRIDARKALDAAVAYQRPAPPPPPVAATTAPPVKVPKIRTTVFLSAKLGDRTLKLNRLQTVPVGSSIVIAGRTKPAVRNTRLVVQRRSKARGTEWKVIRRVKTNGQGRYGFAYTPTTRGKHTLRIVLRGTNTLQRIVSPQIRLQAVRGG